jgi:hypothetical protein
MWRLKDKMVPVTVYSMTMQSWIPNAPGLVERGQWLEKRLKWAGLDLTKTPEPEAHRYMGLCFELFLNGQIPKALLLLGRWARLAGHGEATLVSERPMAISFPGATVVLQETGDFYLAGADRTFNALL